MSHWSPCNVYTCIVLSTITSQEYYTRQIINTINITKVSILDYYCCYDCCYDCCCCCYCFRLSDVYSIIVDGPTLPMEFYNKAANDGFIHIDLIARYVNGDIS